MKKLTLLITIFLFPLNTLAQCLPEPNIPQILSISEVNFHNSEQDYIELFISHPELTSKEDIELIVDNKNVFSSDQLQKFTTIDMNLTSTTEQIILKYRGKYIDGICWKNSSPPTSEVEDLKEYQDLSLTPCFDSAEISKPLLLARKNLYPTYLQSDWQITSNSTPSQENNFLPLPPTAKINIQSGQTQSNSPISLNLDGSSSSDPSNLDLTYNWDFGNGETSTKANPSTVIYDTPGIYTIQLTITNSSGLKDTKFLSINYFQAPSEPEKDEEPKEENNEPETNKEPTDYSQTPIQITSFLPNPDGTDTNNEWIEMTNIGQTQINISNWQIDDQIGQSNPFIISEGTFLEAQSSLKIYNHQSKINLNNNEDSVRLIDPNNNIFSSFPYQNAESGKIIYTNNPPDQEETIEEEQIQTYPQLNITEVFPNPEGSDTGKEWIEIFNPNSQTINTTNWKIQVNNKTIKLPDTNLPSNSFTQIMVNGLTNSETTISLLDPNQESKSELSYTKSKENQSFQSTNQDWIWSKHITPNQSNLQIIETVTTIIKIDEVLQTITIQDQTIINYDSQSIPAEGSQVQISYLQTPSINELIEISFKDEAPTTISSNISPLDTLNYQTSQSSSSGIPWQAQLATYSIISLAGITFRKPISQFIKTKITV